MDAYKAWKLTKQFRDRKVDDYPTIKNKINNAVQKGEEFIMHVDLQKNTIYKLRNEGYYVTWQFDEKTRKTHYMIDWNQEKKDCRVGYDTRLSRFNVE